jgi:hypothetical protein
VSRFLVVVGLLALIAGAGVGCLYRPEPPEGALRCDDHQRCPNGLLCNAVRDGASVMLVCCRTKGCLGVAHSGAATTAVTLVPDTTDAGGAR